MKFLRFFYLVIMLILGYFSCLYQGAFDFRMIFLTILFIIAVILTEYLTSKFNIFYLISFLIALFSAALLSLLFSYMSSFLDLNLNPGIVLGFSFVSFFYLCLVAGYKITRAKFITPTKAKSEVIVVDTSAIVDGRIADLCATRFISARLVIPKFVLKELQQIADSQDSLKRTRGRRGLDILNKMRKSKVGIILDEHDFPEVREVDTKLIQLAKLYSVPILTTDYNLNKVAQLQGVVVLNINDLANALKPVFLPGEVIKIRVVKEGKEHNQGLGYLDDGTMVVVEDARHLIGNILNVVVTSVLQTSAGRIIFTKRLNH